MNRIDWSTYKFRASSLPTIMVNGRSKTDLLSETTKTYLREMWIAEVYGREKYDTTNKYTDKGIICEPDAMDLVKEVTGNMHFKNPTRFNNEFVTGTPDIIVLKDGKALAIKDVKCSYSIHSFQNATEEYALKTYYYQMLGYMWLTGATTAELIFCLVNNPEEQINDEMYRMSFKRPELSTSDEAAAKFKLNFIFDDIPAKDRLKLYMIDFSADDVELLKERLTAAREYLKGVTL